MQRALYLVIVAALVSTIPIEGQMAHRLKGSIRTTAGIPLVNAAVRADALTGFRGEPFAGRKNRPARRSPPVNGISSSSKPGYGCSRPPRRTCCRR